MPQLINPTTHVIIHHCYYLACFLSTNLATKIPSLLAYHLQRLLDTSHHALESVYQRLAIHSIPMAANHFRQPPVSPSKQNIMLLMIDDLSAI